MAHGDGLRVLVVEDDYLVGSLIQAMLTQLGHRVAGRASDGPQAVEMVENLRPDIIVMDVQMPGMDGIEATRLIQERCPTPVVMITAYDSEELVQRAGAAGAGAF